MYLNTFQNYNQNFNFKILFKNMHLIMNTGVLLWFKIEKKFKTDFTQKLVNANKNKMHYLFYCIQ